MVSDRRKEIEDAAEAYSHTEDARTGRTFEAGAEWADASIMEILNAGIDEKEKVQKLQKLLSCKSS